MATFSIFFKTSAVRELKSIPQNDLKRILKRIESLGADPRPRDSEKLSGQERYRIRQGNYRVIYSIENLELTVWVIKVGHRREVF